jgi:hypothetical protein
MRPWWGTGIIVSIRGETGTLRFRSFSYEVVMFFTVNI